VQKARYRDIAIISSISRGIVSRYAVKSSSSNILLLKVKKKEKQCILNMCK